MERGRVVALVAVLCEDRDEARTRREDAKCRCEPEGWKGSQAHPVASAVASAGSAAPILHSSDSTGAVRCIRSGPSTLAPSKARMAQWALDRTCRGGCDGRSRDGPVVGDAAVEPSSLCCGWGTWPET